MAEYNSAKLTRAGRQLLAQAQAGATGIELTRVAFGAGRPAEGAGVEDLTALVDERQSFAVHDVEVLNEATVYVRVAATNRELTAGYEITEIGLYAKGADGAELLYSAVTAVPGREDFMPAYNGVLESVNILEYMVEVADAESVTITAPAGAYALQDDFEKALQRLGEAEAAAQAAQSTAAQVQQAIENGDVGGGAAVLVQLVLAQDGWAPNEAGTDGAQPLWAYRYDAAVEGVTAEMAPVVSLWPGSMDAARRAEVCGCVESLDGALRFLARRAPDADLNATAACFVQGGAGAGAGGGSAVQVIASKTRLGSVIVGDGVDVDAAGRISVDGASILGDESILATDAEMDEVLKEAFEE